MAAVSKAIGYKGASSYQRYEDVDLYRRKYLSPDLVEKLEPVLVGRGDPPISRDEVRALAGLSGQRVAPRLNDDQLEVDGEAYAAITVYDARAAAGPGSDADDVLLNRILFRMQWLRAVTQAPIEQLGVIEVDGDSMEPTLRSGDHVLVDLEQRWPRRSDGIYVIRSGEGLQVKRLSVHPVTSQLTVSSDNPHYESFGDIAPADVNVVGRVVWLGRRV